MFSRSCLIPVPLGAGPFLSITLSHSRLEAYGSSRRHENLCHFKSDVLLSSYLAIAGDSSHQLFNDLELAAEESILVLTELIVVHAQEVKVDTRNGFDEAFKGSRELELPEEASTDAAGSGAGQADLKCDDVIALLCQPEPLPMPSSIAGHY